MQSTVDIGLAVEEKNHNSTSITKEELNRLGSLGWLIGACNVQRLVQDSHNLLVTVELCKTTDIDGLKFKATRTVVYKASADTLVFDTPELAAAVLSQIK